MSGDPALWQDFPPNVLREYSLIADGHRGALIGPRGDIAWMCAPRWDSPAVFASLIGGGGIYAVTPDEPFVWGGYYEPGTLIWRSRWVSTRTTIECREALAMPGDAKRVVLLRRVDAVEDEARMRVVLDLRMDFGAEPLRELHRGDDGTWTARSGDLHVRWRGAEQVEVDDAGRLRTHLRVPGGQHHDLVLEVSDAELPPCEPVDDLWARTEKAWRDDAPGFSSTLSPRDAQHSYAVLRGLTSPGGGMVAAATLGIPERAEKNNSYDYRYVWLRDQAYAGQAAAVAGAFPLLDDAVAFTTARLLEHGDQLAPAYRVGGGVLPHERTLDLPGYPGGTDVVGNWVLGQRQLDVAGEVLQLLAAAARHDRLDADGRRAMDLAVRLVREWWQEPDAGIWELDNRWWTHSRLSCVAGLRTAAEWTTAEQADSWRALADAILEETSRRCLATDRSWQRASDISGPDASLLLPPVRGALAPDDPRTVATLNAVREHLTDDHFVYRFRHSEAALGQDEGAFLLCGFIMALAEWHQGDQVAAVRWFERNRAACGPPGLYAEEYDVVQRQLRGNLPQAFVHAMQLETSSRLAGPSPA
ncbi:MAG TPA: glycoside hydrolase family 15 protein [Angustibacter sp.]|nr:glycoside hydrolase family 15 protein [Angustibacter sp.]